MDQPISPKSAYFLWLSANKEGIIVANPGLDATEIENISEKLWKETDKAPWEQAKATMKEGYDDKVENAEPKERATEAGVQEKIAGNVTKYSSDDDDELLEGYADDDEYADERCVYVQNYDNWGDDWVEESDEDIV